jgi:hypothetical protein
MSKFYVFSDGSAYGTAAFDFACALRKEDDIISVRAPRYISNRMLMLKQVFHIAAQRSQYVDGTPQAIVDDIELRGRVVNSLRQLGIICDVVAAPSLQVYGDSSTQKCSSINQKCFISNIKFLSRHENSLYGVQIL